MQTGKFWSTSGVRRRVANGAAVCRSALGVHRCSWKAAVLWHLHQQLKSAVLPAPWKVCEEWVDRLAAKGAALKRPHLPVIEPEMGKMELEQMLLQAGCRILYGVQVVDAVVADGELRSVIAYSKSGRMEISARIFIDCTGDADLAFAAGVPCEVGNAEYCGLNQSVTRGFRLSYVNLTKYLAAEQACQTTQELKTRRQLVVAKEHEAMPTATCRT
jgi:hypothetical protein